ncbi:hypothetical protein [Bartonella mastomydis]|uniref:hypothetical protein n=1 Tax=Bartonella mastomydis TaxID=1820002 RepID=UPI001116A5AF|nr:hypothetical protein [Bartonella mastomydis]
MQAVLNWIEQHPTLFSALSSVGALLSAIFAFRSIKQTLKLRNEDRMEAERLRKEDKKNFEKTLANAMDIAKATKQQAEALEKLTNVLEKHTEILEQRKLNVLVQRTAMYNDPDNKSQLLIDILLTIVNPTKQIIKINSISIDNDRGYKFIRAVYRGVTDSTILPFGDIYFIQPQSPKYLCFKQPKTEPLIHGNIDPFSLIAFGSLELILTISLLNKNPLIYLIFTMEHTAIDPENPPEQLNFFAHCIRLDNAFNPQ